MASKKILVQLDIATASDLTSPLSGFVGFSAKADGLYQKIGTAPELRLLTSADVQNAILADGSITGAVSQAQTFTLGIKLSNLTQGYIPYASGATKLLSNSPIYTDGTNVGIGTTVPGSLFEIRSNNNARFTINRAGAWAVSPSDIKFNADDAGIDYWTLGMQANSTNNFYLNRDTSNFLTVLHSNGNVGIGTPGPNQQLEITQNFRLPSTAGTTPYGIIYKDNNRFIHDFNYGNNGTVTTAGQNTFVGLNAGNLTMGSTATYSYEASFNTVIGFQSFFFNTTGNSNTTNGSYSLFSNTTGSGNIAIGYAPLFSNTTGGGNIAIGYDSMHANIAGNNNIALGVNALYNTTASNNTAIGHSSLFSNTSGGSNTALGFYAGYYLANGTTGRTTGNNGLYLGMHTKASADGTDNEIVIGYNAIGAGSNKTVIGNSSVTDTYFGSSTGTSKLWASALNLSGLTASKLVFTDGSKNLTSTGIGTASQFIKGDGSLDSNTYLTTGTTIISGSGVAERITFWNGSNSLSSSPYLMWYNDYNTLSTYSINLAYNFKLGSSTTAGYVLTADANGNGTWQAPPTGGGLYTDARYNTAGGIRAGLHLLIDAERNTFLGYEAGRENTTGSYNTAIGSVSLANNTSGYRNTAIGISSIQNNTTGHDNTAIGMYSLIANATGCQNTANGYASLYSNITGNSNTTNGYASLHSNTIGNGNTALGVDSGRYIANSSIGRATGDNGLYLGYDSRASADGTLNEIVIGSGAIGYGSNTITLGNDSIINTILKGVLKLKTVPTVYANNASAITGGLSTGEIYRTSIGVLMIVY